jgi:hypothetical protein
MSIKPAHITHFFLGVFLGVIALIAMNFIGFYVHEFGYSSSAALWTMAKQESSLTITYTYDLFAGVLHVPRSNLSELPWIFAVLSMLIIGLVYFLLAVMICRWGKIKHNRRAKAFVYIPFLILFGKDIFLSLICKIRYCNFITSGFVQLIVDLLMLIALVVFFVDLTFPRTVELEKIGKKKNSKKNHV